MPQSSPRGSKGNMQGDVMALTAAQSQGTAEDGPPVPCRLASFQGTSELVHCSRAVSEGQ